MNGGKITGKNANRQFKLGLHSYTLHLSGCGESWGFQNEGRTFAYEKVLTLEQLMDICVEEGIEVLHMTLVDLDNDTTPEHLAKVKEMAKERGLDLELNISLNAPSDPRVNATISDALEFGHQMGAKLIKFSTDVEHPRILTHSCMGPEAMEQMSKIVMEFKRNIPTIEKYGMKIAIENHCDLFADEVVWMVRELNHPLIGACCDTVNSLMVGEGIAESVRIMAPYTYCVHFKDNKIYADPDGTHSVGAVIGEGSVDVQEIMNILREEAPEELDTIDLEIEVPLSMYTLEEGRKVEFDAMRKSIKYMNEKLNVGINKKYGK